ncbi:MAG: MmgE/PrpD family protein [Acidobacteriota bacterium]|nr:MAG: MmgE/PrpD family protein [Acidobacteriota bacterium]
MTRALANWATGQGGRGESRLLLGSHLVPSTKATLVGSTSAHAHDLDDYAFSNHPSALLVPAILAEAEATGARGDEMLRAYVVGYESWATVMKREPDHLHSKGWHPTGVFGPLGVAAAMAVLHHADEAATRNALGFAVAHASGVMGNFGAMSKPYQGGRAAEAGVTAMRLALSGMDAGPEALDGQRGLLAALSPAGGVDLESPASHLGKDWYIVKHGLNIKRYPMVGASQRIIDAALELSDRETIDAGAIDRVFAHVSEKHAAVMPFSRPRKSAEAKFSLEFAVAAALIAKRVGLDELDNCFVEREDVQALMTKVERAIGADDDPVYPVGARADWIEVKMKDGTMLTSSEVSRARGHGLNPMNDEELREKFLSSVARSLSTDDAEALFQTVQSVGELETVRAIALPDLVHA